MESKKVAVMQISNMQYLVKEGETVEIDKFAGEAGDKVKFDEVLLKIDGATIDVGTPTVEKSSVEAEIVAQVKGEKVRTFTFKHKSRERKAHGHREQLTAVKITKIN